MRKTLEAAAPAFVCGAGLWLLFYPMLGSGFALMQSNLGDTRFLNYALEHGYRWLTGDAHHTALWSPPVFFPQQDTFSYSETLLGLLPAYGVWRAIGFAPDSAMQLLMLVSSVLNFVVLYLLLRREFGTSIPAACFGAFLFAFSSIRGARTGHQHLLPHFFTALAFLSALRVFEDLGATPRKTQLTWLCAFFAALVAQIYAGIYLGWFLCFSLLVGTLWALGLRQYRERLFRLFALQWPALVILALMSLLALTPLITHYRKTAGDVGFRSFAEVTAMLPRLQSWFYLGRDSLPYGWLDSVPAFNSLPLAWEHQIGLGLVTTSLVVFGLWQGSHDPRVRLLALVSATIVSSVTLFPGGLTLWRVVYGIVPGAQAMRGVTRIALLLLLPASVGAALAVDRLLKPRAWFRVLGVTVIVGLSLVEQARWQPSFDKAANRRRIADVAGLVPPGCRAFYYSALHSPASFIYDQLDAMWASVTLGIPTVNGYSGNYPPGWGSPLELGLLFNAVATTRDEEQLGRFLRAWTERKGLPTEAVCWVRDRGP